MIIFRAPGSLAIVNANANANANGYKADITDP
jgi:hypothetical protein